ncbi:DUF397 domain-containing protein [Streptomyces sp. NPDC059278]|uniref:DUF397 domain-containing protein n=1 Tax=Streptomyces sp. NPDC059278 TaxID=3346801 RepID=UPI0036768CF1
MPDRTKSVPSTEFAPEGSWVKSSYSDQGGGNCVEVADVTRTHTVAIRDSKIPDGAALLFTPGAFAGFIAGVQAL